MQVIKIKRRWLRRIVMIAYLPFALVEFTILGMKIMVGGFRHCWKFEHPRD